MINSTQMAILRLLEKGELISGETIGQALGLTRAAVWKSVKTLQALGFSIDSIRQQGYRLEDPIELFDENRLMNSLRMRLSQPFRLEYHASCDSTNDIAMNLTREDNLQIVLADSQTVGRGRRGRTWHSPLGRHLYLSLGFWQTQSMTPLQGLSLVVGLAILNCLRKVGLDGIQLKWPNDLWVEQRKLGGILIDIKGEANHGFNVVLGLGMNVYPDKDLVLLGACYLREFIDITKNDLVELLLPAILEAICALRKNGFASFVSAYNEAHCFHNKVVAIDGASEIKRGRVLGVSDSGGLLVEANGKSHCLFSADVSVST